MKLTGIITKYPLYRPRKAVEKGTNRAMWVIQTQRWAKAKWQVITVEEKVPLYSTREGAEKVCNWLRDPEGTKSEWDTEEAK